MRAIITLGVVVLCTVGVTVGQEVEHNYLVGPQNTDCDSLNLDGLSVENAVKRIQSTKFRLDRQFRLRRPSGLMGGWLYSCNNESGYLIVMFDGVKYLYVEVPLAEWEAFVGSANPEAYYLEKIRVTYTAFGSKTD